MTPAAFFSCYVLTVVTPPTNNRSNSSNPPAVKGVTLTGLAVLLTDSGLIFDEGLGMNQRFDSQSV